MPVCAVCGNTIAPERMRTSRVRTCSAECSYELRLQRVREHHRRQRAQRRKQRFLRGNTGEPREEHVFPCPWASCAISAPECLGVDPVLGF